MMLFVVTLLATAAVLVLDRLGRPRGTAHEEPDVRRTALVGLVVLLPVLYSSLVLFGSWSRLETLQLEYTGKRLAYGADIPLTAGSSPNDSEAYEDLHAPNLGPRALTLLPATEEVADTLEGVEAGDPVIHLASPSPIVRIDGTALNSYPLSDGDRIVLAAGTEPLEIVYNADTLTRGDRSVELPGTFKLLLRGPSQVFYFPDLLAQLAPDATGSYRSLLHRPTARSPWHLLIRDETVEVVRGGRRAASFREVVPVPADFELRFQIVWGRTDSRNLRTVRWDRLILRDAEEAESGSVQVRFGNPQRRIVRLDEYDGPWEMGVVTPNTVDRREELIELDDYSARFRGLSTSLFYDPGEKEATLGYLSGRIEVDFGDLYALGEGADQMLVRLDRTPFPRFLLFDLALLALFVAVFLGRSLVRDAAFLAVAAPAGLLLALRLLFTYKAAHQPPHFFVTGYGEARLALWLVPAALLFGRSLAWVLSRPADAPRHAGSLRWPLLGLGVAGLGCLLTTFGMGNLPLLSLLPWMGAGFLVLVHVGSGRPRWAERLRSWQDSGWHWSYLALVICGASVLVVRGVAGLLGMQETLRIPAIRFRLLWTVIQLPFCAGVVALTLHLVDERRRQLFGSPGELGPRQVARHWLGGVGALLLFLGLAFLGVAVAVSDTGLVIAHSLSAVFGLLLLLSWPRGRSFPPGPTGNRLKLVYGAGTVLVCLPLLFMLLVNLVPEQVVRAADWAGSLVESRAEDTQARQVVDKRAQLMSIRSQRLFRLYMLGNPALLQEVGLQPSERVAIHYATLQSYAETAGFTGRGFASTPLPRHLGITYLSDLVPMVFVLADFGTLGMFALAFVYLTVLAAAVLAFARGRSGRWSRQGSWIACVALLAFVLPSLYMILANLNLVLFTGKNCNLLSLNSISDVLESAGLLGLAAFGLGLGRRNG